jgi:ABC-type Fe3+ transport system permease subunit
METNTMVLVVLTAVVMLVIGGLLGVVFRRQRTKTFGNNLGLNTNEYWTKWAIKDREDELQARVAHVV